MASNEKDFYTLGEAIDMLSEKIGFKIDPKTYARTFRENSFPDKEKEGSGYRFTEQEVNKFINDNRGIALEVKSKGLEKEKKKTEKDIREEEKRNAKFERERRKGYSLPIYSDDNINPGNLYEDQNNKLLTVVKTATINNQNVAFMHQITPEHAELYKNNPGRVIVPVTNIRTEEEVGEFSYLGNLFNLSYAIYNTGNIM